MLTVQQAVTIEKLELGFVVSVNGTVCRYERGRVGLVLPRGIWLVMLGDKVLSSHVTEDEAFTEAIRLHQEDYVEAVDKKVNSVLIY